MWLGFSASSRHCDLNISRTNIPSACKIVTIDPNGVMILPHDASPGRIRFSERTGLLGFSWALVSLSARRGADRTHRAFFLRAHNARSRRYHLQWPPDVTPRLRTSHHQPLERVGMSKDTKPRSRKACLRRPCGWVYSETFWINCPPS